MDIKQARIEAQGSLDRTSKEANGRDWDGAVAVINREALKTLLSRLTTLEAKVKSGVEAAHDVQKKYYDHSRPSYLSWYDEDLEGERLSQRDDVADDILTAMEEPKYYEIKEKEKS